MNKSKNISKIKRKLNITIGIPAYNEEKNILNAINSVFAQKKGNYVLRNILVYSDGSQDSTVKISKSIRSNLIKVNSSSTRKGKSFRLNQMFKDVNSDILMLLDADCVLDDEAVNNMVLKFADPDVVLVGSNAIPINTPSFVSNVIFSGAEINKNAAKKWKSGINVYSFRGAFIGLRREFYKKIKIPSIPGTDAFLYFSAIKMKSRIVYANKSIVYFRTPKFISGHVKQSSRFITSQISMKKYFGDSISGEYRIPKSLLMNETIREIYKKPVYTLIFMFLKMFINSKNLVKQTEMTGIWEIAESTKKAIKIT